MTIFYFIEHIRQKLTLEKALVFALDEWSYLKYKKRTKQLKEGFYFQMKNNQIST